MTSLTSAFLTISNGVIDAVVCKYNQDFLFGISISCLIVAPVNDLQIYIFLGQTDEFAKLRQNILYCNFTRTVFIP